MGHQARSIFDVFFGGAKGHAKAAWVIRGAGGSRVPGPLDRPLSRLLRRCTAIVALQPRSAALEHAAARRAVRSSGGGGGGGGGGGKWPGLQSAAAVAGHGTAVSLWHIDILRDDRETGGLTLICLEDLGRPYSTYQQLQGSKIKPIYRLKSS